MSEQYFPILDCVTSRIYSDRGQESGYRKFSLDSIKLLLFIRKAQSLGFTLEEIKALLELSEEPEADCADVQDYARKKITEMEERITDLIKMKNCLEKLADFYPGEGKPLSECNILKHFYKWSL